MNIKRKQHILPESYLKHWVDPSTKVAGKTPMVWTFSKDAKRRQMKPPARSCFWRDYFYDVISASGERRQDLENLLGRIEGCMDRIVSQRILPKQPLDRAECEELDFFVACMFMRTERMKDSVVSGISAMARIEQAHAQAYGKPIPDTSVMVQNAHAHAIYAGVLFITEEMGKMSHTVFIAPEGKVYLTSDTPCTWQAPIGVAGFANPTLEITLPLTPRHLLHISKTHPASGYIDSPDFLVDERNSQAIRECREYFVANSPILDPSWWESEAYWGVRLFKSAAEAGLL